MNQKDSILLVTAAAPEQEGGPLEAKMCLPAKGGRRLMADFQLLETKQSILRTTYYSCSPVAGRTGREGRGGISSAEGDRRRLAEVSTFKENEITKQKRRKTAYDFRVAMSKLRRIFRGGRVGTQAAAEEAACKLGDDPEWATVDTGGGARLGQAERQLATASRRCQGPSCFYLPCLADSKGPPPPTSLLRKNS